jgi:hypothetical protein
LTVKPVDIRGIEIGITMTCQITVALIVGDDKNNVGFCSVHVLLKIILRWGIADWAIISDQDFVNEIPAIPVLSRRFLFSTHSDSNIKIGLTNPVAVRYKKNVIKSILIGN